MKIRRNEILFGQPALKIREVLRKAIDGKLWGYSQGELADKVATIIKQPVSVAEQIMANLIQEGYLFLEKGKGSELLYRLHDTEKGRRFGLASAISINRQKATQLLNELIARTEAINADTDLAYYVESLHVFGSYLSDEEILGDLDVGFKLTRRYTGDEFDACSQKRTDLARSSGKRFRDFLEELCWSEIEISRMLKNRQQGLSLHNIESDSVFEVTETNTVYHYNKS
jgi:hypothetical protein